MLTPTPFIERYLRGEHTEVWSDLTALPEAAYNSETIVSDSVAVARETMIRVRQNCEELVDRLDRLGYIFSDPPLVEYPSGTSLQSHFLPPLPTATAAIAEIERLAGPLPLALRSFWQYVGAVAFVGQWPTSSVTDDEADPLWVYGPDTTLADLRDFEGDEDWEPSACIAPDYLHKGDISGGAPYQIRLGTVCADADIPGTPYQRDPTGSFGQERFHFVTYLRLAILVWGGFPGFRRTPHLLQDDIRRQLTSGLVPF